jgi:hypothetical protein
MHHLASVPITNHQPLARKLGTEGGKQMHRRPPPLSLRRWTSALEEAEEGRLAPVSRGSAATPKTWPLVPRIELPPWTSSASAHQRDLLLDLRMHGEAVEAAVPLVAPHCELAGTGSDYRRSTARQKAEPHRWRGIKGRRAEEEGLWVGHELDLRRSASWPSGSKLVVLVDSAHRRGRGR